MESFHFSQAFPLILFETDASQMYMHFHECLEINLVKDGEGIYLIEEKQYDIKKGDIFVINNQERHMAVHNGHMKLLVLIFEPDLIRSEQERYDYLEPFFNRSPDFSNRIPAGSPGYSMLSGYLGLILEEQEEKREGWRMFIRGYLMLFLAELCRYCYEMKELGGSARNVHRQYHKLLPALDYIHEHYLDPIELDELARHALMNKSYLCTSFKETMGLRIFEYIEQLRINHACSLLKTTRMSITEVALASGFNSAQYFNKIFKKVRGMTPGAYRKNQI